MTCDCPFRQMLTEEAKRLAALDVYELQALLYHIAAQTNPEGAQFLAQQWVRSQRLKAHLH